MAQPLVTAIVPNYRYSRFFPRFFAALEAQTLGLSEVEILVVDDGSGDGSVEEAARHGAGLSCARFEVLPIRHLGLPGLVRNVGMARARHPDSGATSGEYSQRTSRFVRLFCL